MIQPTQVGFKERFVSSKMLLHNLSGVSVKAFNLIAFQADLRTAQIAINYLKTSVLVTVLFASNTPYTLLSHL